VKRQRCLMIGCGHVRPERRVIAVNSAPQFLTDWVTLDINPDVKPDVLFDLRTLDSGVRLPFKDEEFDELHAYECLEHFGTQGDFKGFFAEFREFWRILKPAGRFAGTCPAVDGQWVWSDPGHRRVINHNTLSYLTRERYEDLGKTAATDYRREVAPNWWTLEHSVNHPDFCRDAYIFCLRKSK